MRSNRWLTVGALASAIVGLAASIASLVDDLRGEAMFCGEGGCALVHASPWAKPLGIPMSALGVAFFAAMCVLAFVRAPRVRTVAAVAGALWAIFLIYLQAFDIGAWCKLCMVADPAAIIHAGCVVAGAGLVAPAARHIAGALAGAGVLVVALAMGLARGGPPPLPEGTPECVVREQQPGVVTVVEFLDFECPFCRKMQPTLEEALATTKHKVRVVRKMLPFSDHPRAGPAAVMWCIADEQGKGEEMARELFKTPVEQLTRKNMLEIAQRLGCNIDDIEAKIERAIQVIKGHIEDARLAEVRALPTMYIGGNVFVGAPPLEDLLAAFDEAAP